MPKIDAETGRWLTNKSWIIIILGLISFVVYADIPATKKHIAEHPSLIKHYDSIVLDYQVRTALIEKDLCEAKEHRYRLEKAINMINTHLERLQLVSNSMSISRDKNNEKEMHTRKKG